MASNPAKPIQPTDKLANIPWHTYLIAMFMIGGTVYFVAQWSDEGAWVYVLILLLGIAMWSANFSQELQNLALP
jgi:uncharacterized membrane protein